MAVEIKSAADIAKMRATCKLAASVLDFIKPHVVPGAKTSDLDQLCHDYIMDHGAYPSPLNYKGFPKSTCISINEVVCHGIPGERVLENGDIVNIDITTTLDGYFGDTSEMFGVGEISDAAQKLIDVTRDSMWIGIKEVAPKKRVGDIGAAIYEFAGQQHGYGVVTDFCGPRHRTRVPHGPADPPRRAPRHSHAPAPRHDLHHRADDQHRHRRLRHPRRRLDRDHPRRGIERPDRAHHLGHAHRL